jgi:hypothetical protein
VNLTESITPNSDQVNAEDLLASPRTVTITGVESGSAEQPVFVHLQEFPNRTYRPSKSMRRVMVTAWGADSSAYVNKQMTIFRNPKIRFGKDEVGGIQISHMSGLEKPLTVALTVTRGKRSPFTVQPLTAPPRPKDESGRDWLAELNLAGDDLAAVNALGAAAVAAHASEQTMALLRGVRDRLQATS